MSGDCEKCGEHCLECKCEPLLKKSMKNGEYEGARFRISEITILPKNPCISIDNYDEGIQLNQSQVAALIPLLEHFVETGRLP